MSKYLLVDADNAFPLTAQGELLLVDEAPNTPAAQVRISDAVVAARLVGQRAADFAANTGDARSHASDPVAARAVALLNAREQMRFDPADGSELAWDDAHASARGASGRLIFPRIDPCVIGIVEHADGERILLGENRRRPGYYTCVAGYVDVGETPEAAFYREVREETGRRVRDVSYVCSQPWALSGSLMLGFYSRTDDTDPHGELDGELSSIIWASRAELLGLTLARRGSIARTLIEKWANGELEVTHSGN